MQTVNDHWGRLDVVFVHAGINGVWAPLETLELEDWQKTINIDLTGTDLTVKYAMPSIKPRGGGSIIITSSVNGSRMFSNTGATAHMYLKAGQIAFMKAIAHAKSGSSCRPDRADWASLLGQGQLPANSTSRVKLNKVQIKTIRASTPTV